MGSEPLLLGTAQRAVPQVDRVAASCRRKACAFIMVTGDSRITARSVARVLRLDDVIAEVLSAQKVEVVRRLHAEGRVVTMAGDGVNDAAAPAAVRARGGR